MKSTMLSKVGKVVLMIVAAFFLFTGQPLSAQTSSAPAKTLKIGYIPFFQNPLSFSGMQTVQTMVDVDNQKGGLLIGGEHYRVQLVVYDSGGNPPATSAAVNRLLAEDGVKFVMGDNYGANFAVPITEAAKAVMVVASSNPLILLPKNQYTFNASPLVSTGNAMIGWFTKKFPQKRKVVSAFPDNQVGQANATGSNKAFENFGIKATNIFFPPQLTDQSAMGTKIKMLNPDVLVTASAAAPYIIKAARESGYRGEILHLDTMSTGAMLGTVPVEALEGLIAAADPTEFDTPPTKTAQDFKKAYMTKFGKWDSPSLGVTPVYACLREALQQAGSLDTDKVASIIGNGLKFESPQGFAQMISRPDLGNMRTVDSISSVTVKKVVGGKPTPLDTISLKDAIAYGQQAMGK